MSTASAFGWSGSGPLLASIAALLVLSTVMAIAPRSQANPHSLSLALSALACVGIFVLGASIIASGSAVTASLGEVLGLALIDVRIDSLGALFLVALGAAGAASAVFGIGYGGHAASGSDRSAAAYPVFLASLAPRVRRRRRVRVPVRLGAHGAQLGGARDRDRAPTLDVARAGYVYLALTHLATAALVVAFAILGGIGGSTSFAAFGAAAASLPPLDAGRRLRPALRRLRHQGRRDPAPRLAAARPPGRAFARLGADVGRDDQGRRSTGSSGSGSRSWARARSGGACSSSAIGVASAVLGVLYALMEHDLKRLLAFHSIENIGIILIGVGVALLAAATQAPALAAARADAQRSSTRSTTRCSSRVLFLAAGSVQAAAGTRDLNHLGGLARRDAGDDARLRDRAPRRSAGCRRSTASPASG